MMNALKGVINDVAVRVMRCCSAADGADDKCYEAFNTAGRFNGHCGLNGTSAGYLRCAAEYAISLCCLVIVLVFLLIRML